ncbi:MAG: extracellular solute-binding protein, partial [Candidatus Hydrogenedentes bacterium]|nr:extracellular solute-binding protein [Candidatus Hydrogenedentota bacterium]
IGYLAAPEGVVPWLRNELHAFQIQNPGITVRLLAPSFPARAELPIQDINVLPNVFCVDSQSGDELPYLTENGLIVPLTSAGLENGEVLERLPSDLMDAATQNGQVWGVPFLCSNLVLAYRPELLSKSGIVGPPGTWQEFLDVCNILAKPPSGGHWRQFGCCLNETGDTLLYTFLSMLIQGGGKIVENGKFVLDYEPLGQAVTTIQSVIGAESIIQIRESMEEAIQMNFPRSAMYIVDTSDVGHILALRDIAFAPLPTFVGNERLTVAHRKLYFVVRHSSQAQEYASWRRIMWLTRMERSFPRQWGSYPVPLASSYPVGTLPGTDLSTPRQIYGVVAAAVDLGFAPKRREAMASFWRYLAPVLELDNVTERHLSVAISTANQEIERAEIPGTKIVSDR